MKRARYLRVVRRQITLFGLSAVAVSVALWTSISLAQGPVLVDPAAEPPEAAPSEPVPAEQEAPSAEIEISPAETDDAAPLDAVEQDLVQQDLVEQAKAEAQRKLEAAKSATREPADDQEPRDAVREDVADEGSLPATHQEMPADELPSDNEASLADPEELPPPDRRPAANTARDLRTRELRLRPSSRDIGRDGRDLDRDVGVEDGRRSVVVRSRDEVQLRRERALVQLGIVLDDQYEDAVVVREVYPDSPAEEIGLRAGDTITRINGREISSAADLLDVLASARSVRNLDLGVARRTTRSVRLGSRNAGDRTIEDRDVNQAAYEDYFRSLPRSTSSDNYRTTIRDYPEAQAGQVVVPAPQPYVTRRPTYSELYRQPEPRRGLFGGRILGRRGR